ncbi:hypothetical protein ACRAWF_40465 [Streptomyces sp. L7]
MSDPAAAEAVRQVILDHLDWVVQPGLRTALVAEVLRPGVLKEIQISSDSPEWRTSSGPAGHHPEVWPDGDLRTEIQAALAEVRGRHDRLARRRL